ncbi:hypothetical protein K461DRAFT_271096 [Myriangium duriaei CBS 260.36]|uniref:Uncharacterized protein n=1 Tax=Myriangium duriaei CBS 260.36 TaxID=1168546 RepID=A0A9P4ITR0_9PEZI|nr:hypothetical protein K461DRAFT_271096 [Myriangium duriaei CBS 260.36]
MKFGTYGAIWYKENGQDEERGPEVYMKRPGNGIRRVEQRQAQARLGSEKAREGDYCSWASEYAEHCGGLGPAVQRYLEWGDGESRGSGSGQWLTGRVAGVGVTGAGWRGGWMFVDAGGWRIDWRESEVGWRAHGHSGWAQREVWQQCDCLAICTCPWTDSGDDPRRARVSSASTGSGASLAARELPLWLFLTTAMPPRLEIWVVRCLGELNGTNGKERSRAPNLSFLSLRSAGSSCTPCALRTARLSAKSLFCLLHNFPHQPPITSIHLVLTCTLESHGSDGAGLVISTESCHNSMGGSHAHACLGLIGLSGTPSASPPTLVRNTAPHPDGGWRKILVSSTDLLATESLQCAAMLRAGLWHHSSPVTFTATAFSYGFFLPMDMFRPSTQRDVCTAHCLHQIPPRERFFSAAESRDTPVCGRKQATARGATPATVRKGDRISEMVMMMRASDPVGQCLCLCQLLDKEKAAREPATPRLPSSEKNFVSVSVLPCQVPRYNSYDGRTCCYPCTTRGGETGVARPAGLSLFRRVSSRIDCYVSILCCMAPHETAFPQSTIGARAGATILVRSTNSTPAMSIQAITACPQPHASLCTIMHTLVRRPENSPKELEDARHSHAIRIVYFQRCHGATAVSVDKCAADQIL